MSCARSKASLNMESCSKTHFTQRRDDAYWIDHEDNERRHIEIMLLVIQNRNHLQKPPPISIDHSIHTNWRKKKFLNGILVVVFFSFFFLSRVLLRILPLARFEREKKKTDDTHFTTIFPKIGIVIVICSGSFFPQNLAFLSLSLSLCQCTCLCWVWTNEFWQIFIIFFLKSIDTCSFVFSHEIWFDWNEHEM